MHTLVDDRPTARLERPSTGEPTGAPAPSMLTLLFELSLAAALPPDSVMAPAGAVKAVVHSSRDALISREAIASVVGRPISEARRGRVSLGEVDARLRGLGVRLEVYRVDDGGGGLISIGLVAPEPVPTAGHGATARFLWALARESLVAHGVPCEHLVGVGDDAYLALHGGRTAQVAWLAGERLATVSVTTMSGQKHRAIDSARAIALLAEERLGWPETPAGQPRSSMTEGG